MNKENWIKEYRKNKEAVWIRCRLTNGEEFNYDKFEGWRTIKEKCDKENLFLSEFYLQFRSHKATIDIGDVDGIYLIRSLLGAIGSKSKEYYTIGLIKGSNVSKKMWITPELILDKEYEDEIENCFEEAIIYDKTKEN
tara:strand:- start:1317 stop:1730 length:414 start_codon:yes stop_codon:yes gene_type:complete